MTDTQQLPQMIAWTWNNTCAERDKARAVDRHVDGLQKRITALEEEIGRLRAQRMEQEEIRAGHVHNAEVGFWLVQQWAEQQNDGRMPAVPDDVPLADTAASPVMAVEQPVAPGLTPCAEDRHASCAGVNCLCPCHSDAVPDRMDDPLRSGIYPAAPAIPSGPYGGDGDDARFHPGRSTGAHPAVGDRDRGGPRG